MQSQQPISEFIIWKLRSFWKLSQTSQQTGRAGANEARGLTEDEHGWLNGLLRGATCYSSIQHTWPSYVIEGIRKEDNLQSYVQLHNIVEPGQFGTFKNCPR